MPGLYGHSPAQVVANLLADIGLATDPANVPGAWPAYSYNEPNLPDDCITVYDTAGVLDASIQNDGEQQGREGIQIRVRSSIPGDGWIKAEVIAKTLDAIKNRQTSVSSTRYLVHNIVRTSGPFSLGREKPSSSRTLHTINFTISLRQQP